MMPLVTPIPSTSADGAAAPRPTACTAKGVERQAKKVRPSKTTQRIHCHLGQWPSGFKEVPLWKLMTQQNFHCGCIIRLFDHGTCDEDVNEKLIIMNLPTCWLWTYKHKLDNVVGGLWTLTYMNIYGGFHKWGYPLKWLVYNWKSNIKTNDLRVPPFQETTIYIYLDSQWASHQHSTYNRGFCPTYLRYHCSLEHYWLWTYGGVPK